MAIPEMITPWIGTALDGGAALLVDIGIKGAVLLFFALLAVMALGRSSAAVRHMVLTTAIVSLLALPALSLVAPEWRLPLFPRVSLTPSSEEAAPEVASVAPQPVTHAVGIASSRVTAPPVAVAEVAGEKPVPHVAVERAEPPAPAVAPTSRAPASGAVAPTAAAGPDLWTRLSALSWGTWVLAVWLAGAVLVSCWVAAGYLAARLFARSRRMITSGPVLDLLDELCYELGITTRITLFEGGAGAMPRTWGIRPKLLLPLEARDWSDRRLRAVLLHELAHVKRRDYLTQLLAHVAQTVHWFNPLVWYAGHRMRTERERACDDQVLASGSRASDYAEYLLDIASSMKAGRFTGVASIAMARRSHLSNRLLDVLDATRRRTAVTPGLSAAVWGVTALVVLPVAGVASDATADQAPRAVAAAAAPDVGREVAPAARGTDSAAPLGLSSAARSRAGAPAPDYVATTAPQQCDWYSRGNDLSSSMQVNDDEMRVRIGMGDCQLRIEAVGEIEFNEAETDVTYISRGGLFEIEEREGRSRMRLEVEPDGDGGLEHRWFVNGDEQAYGRDAQQWFANLLPLVFRRTGFQAEERATRILERDGVDGLLQEISLIPSDYVARKYFEVLLTQADLDEQQLRDIVRQAGRDIDSDYELAELLIGVAQQHPVDEAVQIAYVEAAGSIDSDYETRRVLDAVLDRPGLSQEVASAMLQLATDIDSDYELAELLIGMMQRHPIEETLTPEFFAAVEQLDSDYEHRRVLNAALERGAPNQEVLDLTLQSAQRISSDYEKSELLLQVADLYPTDRSIPASYLNVAATIGSDYESKRVLSALVERGKLSEASLKQLLEAAGEIDSDYEMAELLNSVSRTYELNPAALQSFFRAVGKLGSDHERSRVLSELLDDQPESDAMLEAVLHAASAINSDYELSTLLVKVVTNRTLNDRLRTLYLDVADGISSRYERDRALAALVRRGGDN